MTRRERILELLREGKQVYWWISPASARLARAIIEDSAAEFESFEVGFKVQLAHNRIRFDNGAELVFAWRGEQLRGIHPAAIVGARDPWFRAIGVELIP